MAEAIKTTKTRYNNWDYSGNEELVVSYLKRINFREDKSLIILNH